MLSRMGPRPAQPCSGVGKGFFPDNQIYKATLAPGKRSPRAERSKFFSAPSAARHPQNLRASLSEAKAETQFRQVVGEARDSDPPY